MHAATSIFKPVSPIDDHESDLFENMFLNVWILHLKSREEHVYVLGHGFCRNDTHQL